MTTVEEIMTKINEGENVFITADEGTIRKVIELIHASEQRIVMVDDREVSTEEEKLDDTEIEKILREPVSKIIVDTETEDRLTLPISKILNNYQTITFKVSEDGKTTVG